MKTPARFSLDDTYDATCWVHEAYVEGEIYHVVRWTSTGGIWTPIARFFCRRPVPEEGFLPHWRLDCYMRSEHELAPDAEWSGRTLAGALIREGICSEPLWVSWSESREISGTSFGELADSRDV